MGRNVSIVTLDLSNSRFHVGSYVNSRSNVGSHVNSRPHVGSYICQLSSPCRLICQLSSQHGLPCQLSSIRGLHLLSYEATERVISHPEVPEVHQLLQIQLMCGSLMVGVLYGTNILTDDSLLSQFYMHQNSSFV